MTITPSPIRQSCATWLRPITRHSRPMSVQPSARVERCTVTYSRMTVSAPTRTPEGVPSLYLRSWGTPPSTLPWPTFTRGPSATRPSSTAWWPISTPLSSVTSGPITLKAPTRTPASSRARGSMIAEGWIASLIARPLCARADRRRGPPPRAPARARAAAARADATPPRRSAALPSAAAPADDGIAEGRAVDRGVGADLHVVLDDDAARLRNLAVARAVEGEPEAVGADDGARMHEHAAPEPRARQQRHVRAQHAALADLHVGAHVRERADARARSDARARFDHGQRSHRRRRVDARVRGDDGARVDAREQRGRGVEQQEQIDHRLLRRGHRQDRRGQAGDVGTGDEGARARGLGGRAVAGVGEEGHVVGPGALQRRHAPHHPRGVTLEGGAQRLRELAESELGSADHRRYFFLPPASRS